MIQAQIRMLKDGDSPLAIDERERIVEGEQAIVDDAFARFLQWLAADRAMALSLSSDVDGEPSHA